MSRLNRDLLYIGLLSPIHLLYFSYLYSSRPFSLSRSHSFKPFYVTLMLPACTIFCVPQATALSILSLCFSWCLSVKLSLYRSIYLPRIHFFGPFKKTFRFFLFAARATCVFKFLCAVQGSCPVCKLSLFLSAAKATCLSTALATPAGPPFLVPLGLPTCPRLFMPLRLPSFLPIFMPLKIAYFHLFFAQIKMPAYQPFLFVLLNVPVQPAFFFLFTA
jgi:hypothetical protein